MKTNKKKSKNSATATRIMSVIAHTPTKQLADENLPALRRKIMRVLTCS